MRWLDEIAQEAYLSVYVATDYPEQELAHAAARWYHLLWLLVPLVGFVLFLGAVEEAHQEQLSFDGVDAEISSTAAVNEYPRP